MLHTEYNTSEQTGWPGYDILMHRYNICSLGMLKEQEQ